VASTHVKPVADNFDSEAADAQQSPGGIAHETGELHRLLVESVDEYAIFALDPQGHILSWNPGAERFKGYKADEVIGKHFSIFYPKERIEEGFPDYELREAARVGRFEDEGWRVRKDGSRFWANVVITALHDPAGNLVGYAKVTRDLTERREAEEALRESERRAAAEEAARHVADLVRKRAELLQRLTAAMSAARTTDEVTHVIIDEGVPAVGAAAGALGLMDASGQVIKLVADRGYKEIPNKVRSMRLDSPIPMGQAVRSGKPVICLTREERDRQFPALADTLAPFSASAILPLADRGRVVGALALHFAEGSPLDEDKVQLIEAFAQQAAQALERATLYQAEQSARARADEANRAKSQFLAAMSHELRTPLNAIAGYADLIAIGVRGPVTEEQKEDLGRIKRSQQHLLGIINDILNFSRVEAGQTQYDIAAVPVAEMLESVRQMIAPQAAAKAIDFVVEDCPANAFVWADRAKTEQVLLNLLSNAVKFTSQGSVTLSCELKNSKQVALSVRDTGIGIPDAELDRVFEPFVQVGRSFTQAHEGTGLGLAISRDLARGMGGDITATSTIGEGSTFTVLLPQPAAENSKTTG